jgi:hypothetical protein
MMRDSVGHQPCWGGVMQYKEYKVLFITEGGCGTILLGSSGLPIQKIETTLNQHAAQGWQVVFQVIEKKRYMLFWQREALIVTMGR